MRRFRRGALLLPLLITPVGCIPPLPTTYVIDPEGIARHRWVGGPLGRAEILEEVGPYLDEK